MDNMGNHIYNFGQLSLSVNKTPLYKLILDNDIMAINKIKEITDYSIKRFRGKIYLKIDDIKTQVRTYENIHIYRKLGETVYYAINKDELVKEISYKLTIKRKDITQKVKELEKLIGDINHTLKLLKY